VHVGTVEDPMTLSAESIAVRIVQGAPEAILYADREGSIRLWNAGAEAMFGWTAAEVLGRTMDMIIPERLRARHWDGWNRTMATGTTRYGASDLLAVPALRKDGSTISIEFSIQLLTDGTGQIEWVVAVFRDVTERYARDKALRAQLKELEAKIAAG
jgi:PAS domain S-box-containing protein